MIEKIIQFSIKNKFIVGLCTVALIVSGIYSLTQLPIDATPDITNNQVLVISRAPSLAVQEVESSITAPIEVSPTFFAWIATFGRRVKILSPEPVVAKMQEFLPHHGQLKEKQCNFPFQVFGQVY